MKTTSKTSPETKLKAIAAILNSYQADIEEALERDGEVTLGGNGINCCEANSTFRPLSEEIRAVLTGK